MRTLATLILALQAVVAGAATAPPAKPAAPQTVVLAGGCFWGVEGVYEHMRGVQRVVSGYAGGNQRTATYDEVTTGRTGHAESVQITFDPAQVSYADILRVFFSVAHDPTQLNRQGPDVGTQYRSVIFYASDAERDLARSYIAELNESGKFRGALVTRVDPLERFYPAEGYHQDFMARNPRNPYILAHDLPKLRELEALYPEYYRD